MLPSRNVINHIEHHIASKPSSLMRASNTPRVHGLFIGNLMGLTTAAACCGVRKQLHMADFVK